MKKKQNKKKSSRANMPFLIAGLGNPGDEFSRTRHNIGREIVLAFAKQNDFPEFHSEKKWNADITEGNIGSRKVVVALPNTFVNKSGAAIAPITQFFKIKPDRILLAHDDADILFGSAKLSFDKRSAGHKGAESVIRALKTTAFWRFRIGIGSPRNLAAEKIVLKKFTPDELNLTKKIIKRTLGALEQAITASPEIAMNEYNQ